jgi:hypothetical protein
MQVDEQAEKEAKAELLELKNKWNKINATLKEVQVKPLEAKGYRHQIWQKKDGFRYRFAPFISGKLFSEAMDVFSEIETDLSLALRKGQENYEIEKHKRRIEWIRALGLGSIVAIIVFACIFIIGKLVFNIEIPFPLK